MNMADPNPPGIPISDWMAAVAHWVPDELEGRLSAGEIAALLALAREAAHRSERKAAPLTTFLAGVAVSGLRGPAREARIRELTAALIDVSIDSRLDQTL
jgi:hypothetical protein